MINKVRHGTHQLLHLLPFTVDRTNLFTGRVEMHISDEDFDAPNGTFMNLSYGVGVGQQSGIYAMASGGTTPPQCVGVERRYDEANSIAIYTYTFEGIATRHDQKYIDFELEYTTTQEPIETHPNFKAINSVYGPYDVLNRIWPQYISPQSQATGLQAKSSDQGATLNPMHGISSYYLPGLMYRISYTDIDVNPQVNKGIGSIQIPTLITTAFPALQDWLNDFGGARNWLKMAPKIRQHGSCLSITEEYMLSGYKGWVPEVYSLRSLNVGVL
jgi:hypothetical protein